MTHDVLIHEVGPRDGLQNESADVATTDKIRFVHALADAGLRSIEVTAFVSPRWVPAMADADVVVAALERRPGVRYSALVPNSVGLARATRAGLDAVAILVAASETFSHRNTNRSIAASLTEARVLIDDAHTAGCQVRAYLSTAFGCPYEGSIPEGRVVEIAQQLADAGADEIAVSDTIGVAHPAQVRSLLAALLDRVPANRLALHFHDTFGMAAANVLAAFDVGIRTFDASAGGLGGCPYAPGAAGNLATEDLVYLLNGLGATTAVSLDGVTRASSLIESAVGHSLPSRVLRARRSREDDDTARS